MPEPEPEPEEREHTVFGKARVRSEAQRDARLLASTPLFQRARARAVRRPSPFSELPTGSASAATGTVACDD